jgi:hypothetical protein
MNERDYREFGVPSPRYRSASAAVWLILSMRWISFIALGTTVLRVRAAEEKARHAFLELVFLET